MSDTGLEPTNYIDSDEQEPGMGEVRLGESPTFDTATPPILPAKAGLMTMTPAAQRNDHTGDRSSLGRSLRTGYRRAGNATTQCGPGTAVGSAVDGHPSGNRPGWQSGPRLAESNERG